MGPSEGWGATLLHMGQPSQQKVQPLHLLPPGTFTTILKEHGVKGQSVGALKGHPFLALPFLSPSKVAFSMGSSSAYTKDSTS